MFVPNTLETTLEHFFHGENITPVHCQALSSVPSPAGDTWAS